MFSSMASNTSPPSVLLSGFRQISIMLHVAFIPQSESFRALLKNFRALLALPEYLINKIPNHDINHALGNLELRLCNHVWIKKRHTDDIYSRCHNERCGNVIYVFRYESITAGSVYAHCVVHDTTWYRMPCLTGMSMWLTSLNTCIYKLLTQDRTCSSECSW